MNRLYASREAVLRHETVTGKSGSGKTEYLIWRLSQQLSAGGGALILDAKTDFAFRDKIWDLARAFHREDSLRCIDIDDAKQSHTYNPLLRGDAGAVASRFTETLDAADNPAAEHFRAQGHLALLAAITAVKTLDAPYNAADLYVLLSHPPAMEWLLAQTRAGEARSGYLAWLRSYAAAEPEKGFPRINMQLVRQQTGGVVSRLYAYSVGAAATVTGAYAAEVDLLDAVDHDHVIYVMLPSLDKSEAALGFAKLLFGDLRSVIAALYKRPSWRRPRIPFLVTLDEFGSYANRLVTATFEMARGAKVALMPMFQTYANLRNVSEEFADQIVGNTEISTFFSIGDPATAEFASRIFGQAKRPLAAASSGETWSDANRNLALELLHPTAHTRSRSWSWREAYDYRVRPEEFMELAPGQAFVKFKSENRSYKLRVPLLAVPSRGGFRFVRYRTARRPGLDLMSRFAAPMPSS